MQRQFVYEQRISVTQLTHALTSLPANIGLHVTAALLLLMTAATASASVFSSHL